MKQCAIAHKVDSKMKKTIDDQAQQNLLAPIYPKDLEEQVMWHEQSILLRPIKPEDSEEHQRFFEALSKDDIHMRLFYSMRELQASQLAKLTQIDYDHEMAFIAVRKRTDGSDETLGVVRGITDAENKSAEFAIIIRSDLKAQGLGFLLMNKLITYFRQRGINSLVGEMLSDNTAMHELVHHLGFTLHAEPLDGTMTLRLNL
jgi:RimJ/RimL family protein N-acetyltransferase